MILGKLLSSRTFRDQKRKANTKQNDITIIAPNTTVFVKKEFHLQNYPGPQPTENHDLRHFLHRCYFVFTVGTNIIYI